MDRAPSAEQLLSDATWLRRLAQSLAGEADADDLVQETWIAALRRRPDASRSLRPWLFKVMRDGFECAVAQAIGARHVSPLSPSQMVRRLQTNCWIRSGFTA